MSPKSPQVHASQQARDVFAREFGRSWEDLVGSSRNGLTEEQPNAYKNVDHVVEVVHEANLSRKVARMRPIGVIKG